MVLGMAMRTQGELEAAVCEGISRFEQDYMGRGPKGIRTHLLGDLLVIRLRGVLTAAEQHLVKSLSTEKGRNLLKQVRTHLIETARPVMEAMVQEITGVKVLTLHHDISTVTGGGPGSRGAEGDFSHSARFLSLETPEGVTWHSESGVFLSQPIPLPSTMLLLGSGLLGLVGLRRFRKS